MEFFTDLSDRTSEQLSGGKNDKWQSPIPGTEQVIPPGLYKNNIETGKIPPGLNDLDGDSPGNKTGHVNTDVGLVPPGWTV